MLETYEKIKSILEGAEEDLRKAQGGNKAAGTRARKSMQEIRTLAQELRKQILEVRDSSSDG